MRRRRRLALLGLALVAAGCQRKAETPPDLVARLSEQPITFASFESYLKANAGEGGSELGSDVLTEVFDQFLDERLLLQLAAERGLAPAGSRDITAVGKLLESLATAPSEAEVETYFRAHRDDFRLAERVRLQQILTDERGQAEAARRRLTAGEDFAVVAREVSRAPGGTPSAELTRSELPPELADAIFALEVGEISPVISAPYGFHLFKLTARLPAQDLDLPEAAPRVREILAAEASGARLERLLGEARSRYNLELYAQNLPFDYRGRYLNRSAS